MAAQQVGQSTIFVKPRMGSFIYNSRLPGRTTVEESMKTFKWKIRSMKLSGKFSSIVVSLLILRYLNFAIKMEGVQNFSAVSEF